MARTGSAKWMGGLPDQEDLKDGTALLRIKTRTGTDHYWVYADGKQVRLKKKSDGTVYVVKGKTCTCPDHVNRQVECKHQRALAVSL